MNNNNRLKKLAQLSMLAPLATVTASSFADDSKDSVDLYEIFKNDPWVQYVEELASAHDEDCSRQYSQGDRRLLPWYDNADSWYLNGMVDMSVGQVNQLKRDYHSGHDVLPLVIERKYFATGVADESNKIEAEWRFNDQYFLIHHEKFDRYDDRCGYERPSIQGRGTQGSRFFSHRVHTDGSIEWRTDSHWRNNPEYVERQSDGGWKYLNQEENRTEYYDKDSKILKIVDNATQIALTWTYYSRDHFRITRTGGAYLDYKTNSSKVLTVTTAKNHRYQYYFSGSITEGNYLDKVIYPDNKKVEYEYSARRLSKEKHDGKVVASWKYDRGLLIEQNLGGEVITLSHEFDYNNKKTYITSTNAKGRKTKYTISHNSREVKEILGYGGGLPSTRTKFELLNKGLVRKETDALGNVKQTELNNDGWMTEVTSSPGHDDEVFTYYNWHSKWKIPRTITTDKTETSFEYYSFERPLITKKTVKDRRTRKTQIWTYQYQFHSNGLVSRITENGPRTDVNDISHEYYDTHGRVVRTVNAKGQEQRFSNFNAEGRATRITEPDGSVRSLIFNNRGWVERETISNEAGSLVTKFEYDSQGNVIKTTLPNGIETTAKYDANYQLVETNVGEDSTTYSRLNSLGNIAKTSKLSVKTEIVEGAYESCERRDSQEYNCGYVESEEEQTVKTLLYHQSNEYDSLGRKSRIQVSGNNYVRQNYNLVGQPTTTIDPSGVAIKSLTYDSLGRVKTQTDGEGRITTYGYDTDSNVITIDDNANRSFEMNYDGFGNLDSSYSPMADKFFTYDSANNQTEYKYHDGTRISSKYDVLNRVTEQRLTSGEVYGFQYDRYKSDIGKLSKITQPSGYTEYRYNNKHRSLTSAKYNIDGHSYSLSFKYDPSGKLTSITYPSGYKVDYVLGSTAGKVTTVKGNGSTIARNIKYNAYGPVSELTYGNGERVVKTYDDKYRLKKIDTPGLDLSYGYNINGQLQYKTSSKYRDESASYTYHRDYALKRERKNGVNSDYQYDDIQNRSSLTVGGRTTNYGYDNSARLSTVGSSSNVVRYDDRSNVIQDKHHGGTSYRTFNTMNQLTKVILNGHTTTFKYDALGFRTVKQGRYGTYRFIYSPDGQLLAESKNGRITKEYIYLDGILIALRHNGTLYNVHTDIQGRPEIVTNSSRSIRWHAANTAFGRQVKTNYIDDLNLGFAGQYYDKEVGTWNNKRRDYDEITGRYLQSDPLETVDGPNTYVYTGNNPLLRNDPTGEFWQVLSIAITVADVGYQLYQNGGDLSQLNAAEIMVDMAGGAVLKLGKAAMKTAKAVDNMQKATQKANASKKVSTNSGNSSQKSPCPLSCFVAGTEVLTKDGHKAIEEIVVGDLVWAKNVETGQSEWKPVTHTWIVEDKDIFEVGVTNVDGEYQTIEATASHPFYVLGKGWVDTTDLKLGDKFIDNQGQEIVVDTLKNLNRKDTAYNFTVADFHTYFVTQQNVLVHNCGGLKGATLKEAKQLMSRWDKATYNNIAHNIRDHAKRKGYGSDILKYLRKAANFNKKGAKSTVLEDGAIRWNRKNGEYLIERNGKIVTYGINK